MISYPIYIATKEYQRRKHRKKRIDKKWRKRYGFEEVNTMPYGQVLMFDNVLWMTKRTYKDLVLNSKQKVVIKGVEKYKGE